MGKSGDSYVHIIFSCRNRAQRDSVLQHATPCFDDKEVHCGIRLHSFCRKDRLHTFPLKFDCRKAVFLIVSDARIEHGSIGIIELLLR